MTINSELLAALLFLVFGAAAVLLGWGYGLGTPSRLGTGAMPVLVGGVLCVLGIAQFANATKAARARQRLPRAFSRAEVRPLLLVLGAVLAFAALVIPAGLIPALVVLIAIAWSAQSGGQRWEIAGAMVTVIALIIAIFKLGLGLPIRLFPAGF
ncbi:tripartite tricarboxylate transporter TctB family protein [Chelatococcus asaccharovorans]|uniref:Tripartite tricarboxylate transporter TctB family protein n=1 Tax=Chelatococcus asaccharovorans TaxID=28210 RepID=A0A2V3TXC9_9HYPH|nr:tripartite tricarboxylate transporter TctB family protein [Chelatococcus asaccharovorans]MBS7705032.1 tripartite tricarboxylate transporter TctB family protein [Chelatococcus asaccharovorans]PXW53522.1 tripartite tricarboxylate transporter TctB family protein [Chelatococcus asaccharovorans]